MTKIPKYVLWKKKPWKWGQEMQIGRLCPTSGRLTAPRQQKSKSSTFSETKYFEWPWWQALEQFCWWFTLARLSLYYFARLSVIQGDEHKHEHYPWEADHQSGVGLSVGSLSYRDQRLRVDPSSCQIPTPFIAIHVICLNTWGKVWNSEQIVSTYKLQGKGGI